MRRRRLLAGVLAAGASTVLSGCFGRPRAELSLTPIGDDRLHERASQSYENNPERDALVGAAAENGSVTAEGIREPIDSDWPIAADEGYYVFTVERTAVGELVEFEVVVGDGTDAADGEGAITFEELPDIDRETLGPMLPPPENGPNRAPGRYDERERDRSLLLPEPDADAVVRNGRRYSIELDGVETHTRYEFAYEAEQVAADAPTFRSWLRSTYRFDLQARSAGQREILEEAVDGTYLARDPGEAFSSLAEQFRSHRGFGVGEHGGEWLVRYDGAEYWALLVD